ALSRLDHRRRHHKPRESLVVGRHDIPRRVRPAGCADHVLVGGHVFVPELALGDVATRRLFFWSSTGHWDGCLRPPRRRRLPESVLASRLVLPLEETRSYMRLNAEFTLFREP